MISRGAVLHCVRAARRSGKITPYTRVSRTRRIGRPKEPMNSRCLLNRFIQDTRLCNDYTIGRVNGKNTLHALKRQCDAALFRQAAARGASTASTWCGGRLVLIAKCQHLLNLEAGHRKHYHVRGAKPPAIVISVGKAVHRIGQYPLDG